jgi:DNA-binding transcriptional LysR family regulator
MRSFRELFANHGTLCCNGAQMQNLTEVRLLIAVVTLAEELNFTRAAKILDISQSTMTRRISAVEKRYRIKLFERDHANVKLTESGRRL